MAEDGQETRPYSEVSRARNLLAQAVEVLGGSPAPTSNSHSTPEPSSSLITPRSRQLSSALSERNLLFNYDRKRSGSIKSGKSKKVKVAFWSHDFVCLADNDQVKAPSPYERSMLLAAGLGPKRLRLSLTDDYDDVHYYIVEAFPKLKEAGGYELLRASNGRVLELIPVPPDGYSVSYLKDVMQQAKIYIRPIQKCLDVDKEDSKALCPKEKCMTCGKDIPFTDLRTHMDECKSVVEKKENPQESDLEDFDVPCNKCDVEETEEVLVTHAVIQSQENLPSTSETAHQFSTLKDVITFLQGKLKPFTYEIQVLREDLLNDVIKATKRPSFDPMKRIETWFIGECGRDTGGVTRELWRLFGYCLVGLCEGTPNCLVFRHDSGRVSNGDYHSIGVLVGMSVIQGGSGYPFFAPSLYQYICGKDVCSISPELIEVPDLELRTVLEKLSNTKEEKEARAIAMESCDMLVDCGFTKPLATIKSTDVSQLVKCASLHSTLLRIKSELDQFISGLHSSGVLEAIREYPSFFSPMFEFKGNVLTADEILNLFSNKMFSENGSPQLQKERISYTFFRDLLYEIEGGELDVVLSEVLGFFTGAGSIPPLGFESATLTFNPENPYPTASTCGLSLTIPTKYETYDQFKQHFLFAMCNHGGFGLY